jgi:hypothetical protein
MNSSESRMAPGPLFVVGMWRSGTSLTYALLNKHPQIKLMYESDLALLWPIFLVPRKSPEWLAKWDSWNGALARHKIDQDAIPRDISDPAGAFQAVAEQYARKKGATVWGCKSPTYYDSMTRLLDWFPNAKFIVIWRDPADVCRSIVRAARKSPWFARPGTPLRALLGCRRMKQQADEVARRGAAVHQIAYDELVRDPEAAMVAMCEFIGVPYDAAMTSLEGADRSAIYNGEHHSNVKSTAIAVNQQRPEVLSPEFKSKIERYVNYWRTECPGSWLQPTAAPGDAASAAFTERFADRLKLAAFRFRDKIVPFAFAVVPASWWQKYRKVKYHGVQAPSEHEAA